jgi:sortase (surface protein transpeptidase)
MKKWIIVFVIIALLLLSFYLLEKEEKHEKYEPSKEQLKAEEKAYCMEGCDWDEECVEGRCN